MVLGHCSSFLASIYLCLMPFMASTIFFVVGVPIDIKIGANVQFLHLMVTFTGDFQFFTGQR